MGCVESQGPTWCFPVLKVDVSVLRFLANIFGQLNDPPSVRWQYYSIVLDIQYAWSVLYIWVSPDANIRYCTLSDIRLRSRQTGWQDRASNPFGPPPHPGDQAARCLDLESYTMAHWRGFLMQWGGSNWLNQACCPLFASFSKQRDLQPKNQPLVRSWSNFGGSIGARI